MFDIALGFAWNLIHYRGNKRGDNGVIHGNKGDLHILTTRKLNGCEFNQEGFIAINIK